MLICEYKFILLVKISFSCDLVFHGCQFPAASGHDQGCLKKGIVGEKFAFFQALFQYYIYPYFIVQEAGNIPPYQTTDKRISAVFIACLSG